MCKPRVTECITTLCDPTRSRDTLGSCNLPSSGLFMSWTYLILSLEDALQYHFYQYNKIYYILLQPIWLLHPLSISRWNIKLVTINVISDDNCAGHIGCQAARPANSDICNLTWLMPRFVTNAFVSKTVSQLVLFRWTVRYLSKKILFRRCGLLMTLT